jgi:zinc protease
MMTPSTLAVSASHKGPALFSKTLANGLKVLIIPDRRAPVVTHMLWYHNGSGDDPVGKSGIAHFLEHLMFKGTAKYPLGTFDKAVSAVGGWQNAFTSYDYTAYIQRVAPEHLPTMMTMEADRMKGLLLSDEVVASERKVVLEERSMSVEADPSSQMFEAMSAALFTRHPYGIPIIGFMHEIEGLGREDALAYYRRFYTPENAALVLAGDIDPEKGFELAQDIYGSIAPFDKAPTRFRPLEPPSRAERRVSVSDSKVEQPLVYRIYSVASEKTGDVKDVRALEVFTRILGGGNTSRLYRELVMGQALASSAGSFYHPMRRDDGLFGIYAYPKEGVSLETLEAAMDDVLANILNEGVREDEMKRAKKLLVARTLYQQDSQYSLAYHYGQALSIGLDLTTLANWPSQIEAVTSSDILNAVQKELTMRKSVTGYLLPESVEEREPA